MADFEKVGKELINYKTWLWFAPLGFLTVLVAGWLSPLVSWGSYELPILGAISASVIAAVWAMVIRPPAMG